MQHLPPNLSAYTPLSLRLSAQKSVRAGSPSPTKLVGFPLGPAHKTAIRRYIRSSQTGIHSCSVALFTTGSRSESFHLSKQVGASSRRATLQRAGVHHHLHGYSLTRRTSSSVDPRRSLLVPTKVLQRYTALRATGPDATAQRSLGPVRCSPITCDPRA